MSQRWQFWIDRGGTFTDIVARQPDGQLRVHKLLSEQPDRYADAAIQGIREILGLTATEPLPTEQIEAVKMGTTVATNALLERQGDRVVLVITQGFGDALRIGYQNRPDIFAQQIVLPTMLYERVIEVAERYSAQGEVLLPIALTPLRADLQAAYEAGLRACAIVLMHGYRYPQHEQRVAAIAADIGFTQISVSHQVSPLIKLISRGDTTVVDAYLSPILRRYIDRVVADLRPAARLVSPQLLFMQSNGGLIDAAAFQGKDSILSGPAGGIVGAVQTSQLAGLTKIISFDMGGTSTDVAHYDGHYERTLATEVAGVRLRAPMMAIHTVAAGGGSVLRFDGARYRVGPASAGAQPGPACYRQGGPLTVTDGNVMLGRIQPEFFPQVFGATGNLPLDRAIVQQQFADLAAEIKAVTGHDRPPEQVAQGFIAIAVEKMANAIKKISVQRGYDVTQYTLCCFGGAGGQHACAIAEALGMPQIFLHPYAGVLSAYGMGLADQRVLREQSVEQTLEASLLTTLQTMLDGLTEQAKAELIRQGMAAAAIGSQSQVYLRYQGTDSTLGVEFGNVVTMTDQFQQAHQQRYGFVMANQPLVVATLAVEVIGTANPIAEPLITTPRSQPLTPITTVRLWGGQQWQLTPVFQRADLRPGDRVSSPALIVETTGTIVIDPGWIGELTAHGHLLLKRGDEQAPSQAKLSERSLTTADRVSADPARPDPVKLEIFNHLFMAIAEQMGFTLQNTSYSVNIKERLDFSCAIFDGNGQLVANAPHIPVHLGSMGDSVVSLMRDRQLNPGDVYIANNPYNGGTHLPDITVITPVFLPSASTPCFYVAARGHHADVGGITPGSMPPHSTSIQQEGILIDNWQLVDRGQLREAELRQLLTTGPYPVRNFDQNIADLKAQVAANETGVRELHKMVTQFGLTMVQVYMQHVQDQAEESVRGAIAALSAGSFVYAMDNSSVIKVTVTVDRTNRTAKIDFTGTSDQQPTNFNAPLAVSKAAVLYVFRTLVADDIPLNAGCLKPLEIIVPVGCLLNPREPAAIVAGNVETSQAVTDALYGALGVMAAAQGTMNNFTFGNQHYQYYETICGGSGAGPTFAGTDAVQTHMTNSRLTDPEVLELRFPVRLEQFAIRPESGGQGRYRGGNGVVRRLRFRAAMTAAILAGHRRVPPFGLAGGAAGQVGRNWVERGDGTIVPLASQAEVLMQPDDVFVIETPGGGGYGATTELVGGQKTAPTSAMSALDQLAKPINETTVTRTNEL
jgi:5-oxoprolinase (ATP-hydrolysing)